MYLYDRNTERYVSNNLPLFVVDVEGEISEETDSVEVVVCSVLSSEVSYQTSSYPLIPMTTFFHNVSLDHFYKLSIPFLLSNPAKFFTCLKILLLKITTL